MVIKLEEKGSRRELRDTDPKKQTSLKLAP
jgi:hypothetical protein